jgi:hypothetical protein
VDGNQLKEYEDFTKTFGQDGWSIIAFFKRISSIKAIIELLNILSPLKEQKIKNIGSDLSQLSQMAPHSTSEN